MFKRLVISILFAFCFCNLWGQEGDRLALFEQAVTRQSGYDPVGGNTLRRTQRGEEFMTWVMEDILQARESIDIEYYWLSTDYVGQQLCELLKQKAGEGVQVRLLIENMVTPFALEAFYLDLRKAGIQVRYVHDFRRMDIIKSLASFLGMRDHRKIVVIDRKIAYTGGMNFCKEAYSDWLDTQVRVEGPIAAALLHTLEKEWVEAGGEAFPVDLPSGEGPLKMQVVTSEKKASMEDIYVQAIEMAQHYFYAQTPYFCPPERILQALKNAAARGVDVRLLLPERCDWGFMNELSRDYFEQLLAAGIGVSLFGEVYDHSKTFVCDGALTYVGTANLDKRSFRINQEVGLFIYDNALSEEFTRHFLDLEAVCTHPQPGESIARGIHVPYRAFLHSLDALF